jgi:hypothetical protein
VAVVILMNMFVIVVRAFELTCCRVAHVGRLTRESAGIGHARARSQSETLSAAKAAKRLW